VSGFPPHPRALALVPARSGSLRVPGKNIRPLAGHPLIAYAIAAALESGVFERVVCSTDSEQIAEIARHYGAEVPFLRPAEYATATSPDIEFIRHALDALPERYELVGLIRCTNPFRGPDAIRRGLEQLLATPEADSLRAVELVKQHPGKMWLIADDGRTMRPLLDQSHLENAWHAGQYQALPQVWVQNSALELVWTRAIEETGTREGRVQAPFLTRGYEGFNLDDEDDWARAEALVASGAAKLTPVDRPAFAA
jgi:CMP-N,N'-diacetyllegionaminic acid synthase